MSHISFDDAVWKQAREYHLLLHSGDYSAAQLAQVKAWLAQNTIHAHCFREMEVQRRQTLYSSMGEEAFLSQQGAQRSGRVKMTTRYWLMVACVAMFSGLLLFMHWQIPHVTEYKTTRGEIKAFTLADGSELVLGAKSRIEVTFKDNQRHVTQTDGDVIFRVAKDAARPFVVSVNNTNVTVLGTVFEVSRRNSALQITVSEGHVAVSNALHNEALIAQQMLRVEENGEFSPVQHADVSQFASWQQERFTFRQTSIAEIVSVINRYRQHPIKFSHPKVGEQKVSASFRLDQLNQFLDALAVSHDLDWHIDSNGVIWLQI